MNLMKLVCNSFLNSFLNVSISDHFDLFIIVVFRIHFNTLLNFCAAILGKINWLILKNILWNFESLIISP